MSAQSSHPLETFPSYPSTPSSTSSSLSPHFFPIMPGMTPPPSPSPFMRTFHASQPPPMKHSIHPQSLHVSFPLQMLKRLRRTWREDRNFRRFFLLALLLLPTIVIAAYFAGAAVSYRTVPDAYAPKLVRRQTVDGADAPVLSLGGGLGSQSTSSPTSTTSTISAQSGSTSLLLSSTPTTTVPTTAPSVPDSPVLPTPFVQPFDTTLSTDFVSASCQTFFANLTQSLSFRQCRPFSLLISTSQEFLAAQSNLTLLTSIIYGTCSTTPSEADCTSRMNDLAIELKGVCSAELNDGHAMAWDAFNGMKNYAMMREAACLRNLRTNAYCYADAIAGSPPSDIYFYQLPLGTPLPGTTVTTTSVGASSTASKVAEEEQLAKRASKDEKTNITPTCSPCTRSLMDVYATYAQNSSLLISTTYASAQRALEETCGSGYASAVSAATASTGKIGATLILALVLTVVGGAL